MNRIQNLAIRAALFSLMTTGAALAQDQSTPVPPATQTAPADSTTMTKSQLKDQRKQQKLQEKSANAQAKAAKSDAKATKAANKATQDKEKAASANQTAHPTPAPTTTPQ
jgi:hypothetical protein